MEPLAFVHLNRIVLARILLDVGPGRIFRHDLINARLAKHVACTVEKRNTFQI